MDRRSASSNGLDPTISSNSFVLIGFNRKDDPDGALFTELLRAAELLDEGSVTFVALAAVIVTADRAGAAVLLIALLVVMMEDEVALWDIKLPLETDEDMFPSATGTWT